MMRWLLRAAVVALFTLSPARAVDIKICVSQEPTIRWHQWRFVRCWRVVAADGSVIYVSWETAKAGAMVGKGVDFDP